jgi:hypothetical protein
MGGRIRQRAHKCHNTSPPTGARAAFAAKPQGCTRPGWRGDTWYKFFRWLLYTYLVIWQILLLDKARQPERGQHLRRSRRAARARVGEAIHTKTPHLSAGWGFICVG